MTGAGARLDRLRALGLAGLLATLGCAESKLTGRDEYFAAACHRCHGDQRAGTKLAPPLTNVAAHWTAADLGRFLDDPAEFIARDPRLQAQAKEYGSSMPSYSVLTAARKQRLIAYLLGEP